MKKKLSLLFFLVIISYVYSYEVDVVIGEKSLFYDGTKSSLQKNEIHKIIAAKTSNTNDAEEFPYLKDDNGLAFRIIDLKPQNSNNYFPENIISYGSSEDTVIYLPFYFGEALQYQNPKKLADYNVFFKEFMRDRYYQNINDYLAHKTSYFPIISNIMISFMTRENILITNITKKNESCYIIDGINAGYVYFDPEDYARYLFYFLLLDYETGEELKIEMTIDGDYITIKELNKNKFLTTLIKVNQSFVDQCINLFANKPVDLSCVTWPRHADGSCDFEEGKTLVASLSSTTNVAPNKVMTVSEKLKLRSAEATTSTVLNVMAAGTKVKVLELGKAETIEGISSNWVKIEIISGKDRDGNKLKSGMTGWCYGGYLQ